MLRIAADCIFMTLYINSAEPQPARKKQKRQTVTKKEKKRTKKKVRQLKVQERHSGQFNRQAKAGQFCLS